jgi:hypothetical protein
VDRGRIAFVSETLTFDDLLRFHREVLMPEFAAVRTELESEILDLRVELRGEVGAVRGEVAGVENRLRDELRALDAGLHDEITAARTDLATQLFVRTDMLATEMRSFRGDFDTLRDDALTRFDAIYHRLQSGAFELQALKLAVTRLERQPPAERA